jgi:U4/U6 small nuclear ribonucleoprotein PRP31
MSDDEEFDDDATGTLADDFLADLDDLDSGDEEEVEEEQAEDTATAQAGGGVKSVAKLMESERFTSIHADINRFKEEGTEREIVGALEEDPEYKLIVETNQMSAEMDDEMMVVHTFIRDLYASKFPELESLVLNPVDYARVVKVIGNEMDMTLVNLEEVLPSATIMVVSVTGSTTSGKPLQEEELSKVVEGCDEMLRIFAARIEMLEYVESRMTKFAPNISALIGTSLASQIIGLAGGLTALSKIPSCNIQALGSSQKSLQGLASKAGSGTGTNSGLLSQCEIVQTAPPALKMRALRLVAGKVTLAARIDSFHQDTAGSSGLNFQEEILKRLDKLQEPPPPKQAKPLPVPGGGTKKKRGGKRYRKMKEQYAMTDARKLQNRVAFGKLQDDDLEGKNLGMLGLKSGSGKVRVNMESKRMMKAMKKQKLSNSSRGGATSGLSSSLAFTPVQGLELENPNAKAFNLKNNDSTYFSSTSGFKSVGPQSQTPKTET